MTEGGHDDRRHRPADDPLFRGNGVQQPDLRADTVVRPAFQLEDRLQVFRRGDAIEKAHRGIAARHETGGIAPAHPRDGRKQIHQPRLASSNRRVCSNPSMPLSIMSVNAGRPPNIGFALGNRTHRSASD